MKPGVERGAIYEAIDGTRKRVYITKIIPIHCNRCGKEIDKYPSGRKGHSRTICCTEYGWEKTHCNLCGTNESPQWRSWRGFHCCNACGIKAWRHYDSTYYKPVPGKRTASLATLTAKDKQGGQDLLQYLKDIGEL